MDTQGQWCDCRLCPDGGKVNAGNIRVLSYIERRFYCATCGRTFSADHGTFFASLRSARAEVLETLALLVERNSLRAIERTQHHPTDTVLHWLDLAGQHCAGVSQQLIQAIRLNQAQIDELWTFVKKTGTSSTERFGGGRRYLGVACPGPAQSIARCDLSQS
jgi:transposase-like protein